MSSNVASGSVVVVFKCSASLVSVSAMNRTNNNGPPFVRQLLRPRQAPTAVQHPWQHHQFCHLFHLPTFRRTIALSFRLSLQLSWHHLPPCCLPFVTRWHKIRRRLKIKSLRLYPHNRRHPRSLLPLHASAASTTQDTLVAPSFISTFSTLGSPPVFSSHLPATSIANPPMVVGGSSSGATANFSTLPTKNNAFPIGPGYAPLPYKLVAKITGSQFIDLADLFPDNVRAQEIEPQAFPEGKLALTGSKKRFV